MGSPLVETKLYVPQVRRGAVARPRLDELLARGADAAMTLVSAPAGFGKTTVLAHWLRHRAEGRPVAWLSLDARDSEPVSFWTGVAAAVYRAAGAGSDVLPMLQSGQAIEAALATMLNELAGLPDGLDLVLDDFHLADGPDVQAGMTFLLDHLPPTVHLVLLTRADPALPLARLRAAGELVEVRAADLRFTLDEAAAYLNRAQGLDLAAEDVAALEERTEGWIAALQLAALSLRDRDDAAGFIASFAGDDRYVVDYLVDEVLGRQPDDVRDFLLRTSVLDRLTGPLCDAVTGRGDSRALLETLDRTNLFVVRLDDNRHWYRYHHLFMDVLRTHLLDERSGEVADLHRRASRWYADQPDEPVPAVHHALAAGDVDRAADLVELAIPELQRQRQEATIRGWLDDLPDAVVHARPVLAVGLIGGLMSRGELHGVEERLRDVERLLTSGEQGEMVVVDRDMLARLPGTMEMYRAALALASGDPAGTVHHAALALGRAPEDDHLTRAGASALDGLARWGEGDLDGAHAAYSVAVDGLRRAGNIADVLACSIALGDIRVTQGRLSDARRTYEQALELAAGTRGTLRGTPDMYVGLGMVAWERGDVETARSHVQRAGELGEPAGLPQHPYRLRVALAQLREGDGDLVGARELLEKAERVHTTDFSPDVRPVPATRARLLIAQGELAAAEEWARRAGLSPEDDPSYLREYEHVTLARLLLARHAARRSERSTERRTEAGPLRQAAVLLGRLRASAEQGGRTGTVIEILVLQALCSDAAGDRRGALSSLERALDLAEPEGHVRVFVREGRPMTALLRDLTRQRGESAQVSALLAYDARAAAVRRGAAAPGLVEPLSERELDVLRLLATDLDGPDIARELSVSLATVRTHTSHIYAKLGVNNRRAAVRRAGELDLLSRR